MRLRLVGFLAVGLLVVGLAAPAGAQPLSGFGYAGNPFMGPHGTIGQPYVYGPAGGGYAGATNYYSPGTTYVNPGGTTYYNSGYYGNMPAQGYNTGYVPYTAYSPYTIATPYYYSTTNRGYSYGPGGYARGRRWGWR